MPIIFSRGQGNVFKCLFYLISSKTLRLVSNKKTIFLLLTFKKLQPEIDWHFCLKNCLKQFINYQNSCRLLVCLLI